MNSSKFTPEEIQKAREVSIHSLLGLNHNRRVAIRCPFHNERTPSCNIYPDNSYYCFSCQAKGNNAIDFVVGMGATFNEAVKELIGDNK
jgi:DNA primase